MYIHEYASEIHIGPLDEWTCQITPLIIVKHATMTILE